ncbi:MAG: PQQ-binding-like beta-propeller repeat protein [Acidobacteria bacterium]|nr:PQQ-binding-like beta-propeller repeat protein [Acidobacteriota bacterium]
MTAVLACLLSAVDAFAGEENWAQWRGPNQNGATASAHDLPVQFGPDRNMRWKVALPSWSAATPVVWGDTIFVTSAEEGFHDVQQYKPGEQPKAGAKPEPGSATRDKILLLAINRADGKIRWNRQIGDHNRIYRKHNLASPSPVTDGRRVWAMTGGGSLRCFDFEGKQLWERDIQHDYGAFGLNHGYASSPLLDSGRLYIQVLHGMRTDDPSYVFAVDASTGKTLWKVERPTDAPNESPDDYSTPIIATIDGQRQLIVSGGDYVTGHSLQTGKEVWRMGGFNPGAERFYRTIASSLAIGDVIYTTSTRGKPFIAFRAGGKGPLPPSAMVWQNDLGSDVPTPTTDGRRIFVVNDRGIVVALDAKTGKVLWDRERIEPGIYSASPLLADGKIYATNEDGTTTVLSAGPEFEILTVNRLDSHTLASPVAVGDQLFIRTAEYLYCFSKK